MATSNAMAHSHEAAHDHDHEHSDNFWTKYIFSTDHKMIAKQFLITGLLWAFLGGALSVIFRLQLGFPDMDLGFLRTETTHYLYAYRSFHHPNFRV